MGKVPDAAAEFTQGYADYLQAPLQPLTDDLGSMTYEVFERDPVKYRQYEEVRRVSVVFGWICGLVKWRYLLFRQSCWLCKICLPMRLGRSPSPPVI